jgi:uncharacterized iron-regulated protein
MVMMRGGIFVLALAVGLAACTTLGSDAARRIDTLLPADVILLGEQHDAAAHQQIQREVVRDLVTRGRLAALALEMAEQGRDTRGLGPQATEAEVQSALGWREAGWPWARYGPTVMAAVRAGVPVLGANLPRDAMRTAMADARFDAHLGARLLPEHQIAPMTRIQIARDAAMAGTVAAARQDGKTVVLVAGGAHVLRDVGVPTHLPSTLRTRVVMAVAGQPETRRDDAVDMVWPTEPLPPRDHCEELRRQLKR